MRRSKHSLSHYKMISNNMGNLIPIQCVPVIPGDTMQGQTSLLLRLAPLNTPVMHPVQIRLDTWFVPYRILDDTFEDFITGDSSATVPTVTPVSLGGLDELGPYFDIDPNFDGPVCAYPYRAYNKIFSTRYRDQDLQTGVSDPAPDQQLVLNCAWEKDYYTTARPWAQKGGQVTIPVRTDSAAGNSAIVSKVDPLSANQGAFLNAGGPNLTIGAATTSEPTLWIDPTDLRLGAALQRYGEARARYGSRFTEYLRYIGIRPSDARLQDPEFLGGGRGMVNFSEVLQTAPDAVSGDTAQGGDGVGTLKGHGIAGVRTRKWRRFFEEFGVVMTLLSVRPKSVYEDVTLREWLKTTPEDFFQKELANVGSQPLWAGEVYGDNPGNIYDEWGYGPRYGEYRFHPSTVKGEFQTVLNTWHMARGFASPPTLNESFIKCEPTERIFQDSTSDTLYCMVNNSLVARRMVPRNNGVGRVV